jgi:hypothetical protein
MAETKGQRVRVYSEPLLRSQVKAQFPEAVEWPRIGLPDNSSSCWRPDDQPLLLWASIL